MQTTPVPVDVLAIAAHPDDVELLCGGTLIKAASQGHATGVLDLSRGEMGTRGSPELRAQEAQRAASVMGVSARVNAELPDGGIESTAETRAHVAALVRRFRPRVVIAPAAQGKHPDHIAAAQLRNHCRRAGVQIGTIDALLAQLCSRNDLTMLSTDQDFSHMARHCTLTLWRAPT